MRNRVEIKSVAEALGVSFSELWDLFEIHGCGPGELEKVLRLEARRRTQAAPDSATAQAIVIDMHSKYVALFR